MFFYFHSPICKYLLIVIFVNHLTFLLMLIFGVWTQHCNHIYNDYAVLTLVLSFIDGPFVPQFPYSLILILIHPMMTGNIVLKTLYLARCASIRFSVITFWRWLSVILKDEQQILLVYGSWIMSLTLSLKPYKCCSIIFTISS